MTYCEFGRKRRFAPKLLCDHLANASSDSLILAVGEEELLELSTTECALYKLSVKILEDVADVGVSNLLNLVEDSLVSLLGNCSLAGVTKAPLGNEELLEYVLEVELTAPAPALSEGHCDSVTIVYLSELVSVGGINYVTAKNTGEGVTSEHSALAGTTTGDYKIACAGVEKNCGEDTDLNVGELLLVLSRVHTVVIYLVTKGLYNLLKSVADKSVLSRLAVLVNKCNFHYKNSFLVIKIKSLSG